MPNLVAIRYNSRLYHCYDVVLSGSETGKGSEANKMFSSSNLWFVHVRNPDNQLLSPACAAYVLLSTCTKPKNEGGSALS